MSIVHTAPKIRSKYSQKLNCSASLPVSAFMYLWTIYIFWRSVCLFYFIAFADRTVRGNIEIAHTHRNVEIGAAQFHFREWLFRIFSTVHLQCIDIKQVQAGATLDLFVFQTPYSSVSNTDNSCTVKSTFVFRYLHAAEDTIRILLKKVKNKARQL